MQVMHIDITMCVSNTLIEHYNFGLEETTQKIHVLHTYNYTYISYKHLIT